MFALGAAVVGAAPKRLMGALAGVAAGADAPHWNAGWEAAGTIAPNAGAEDGAPKALEDAPLKLKALEEAAAGAPLKLKAPADAAMFRCV